MKLYFLRHGLAGDRDEWTGSDYDRPLTEEGKERMAHQAATMAKLAVDQPSYARYQRELTGS